MRTSFLSLLLSFFIFTSAHASPLYSCKKRNPWVYTSFEWAEIVKTPGDALQFNWGKGVDTQMLEIDFSSGVDQVSEGHFTMTDPAFQLDVQITKTSSQKVVMSFSVKTDKKTYKRDSFICE